MANEATIRIGLSIQGGNLNYQNQPTGWQVDVAGRKGPTPGSIAVPTTGVDVLFSELDTPGECFLFNQSETNYVEYGIHDGSVFHPLGEIPPGKGDKIRFSRNLGVERDVPGTGTTGVVNFFHLRANGATCNVRIDAFEA